MEMFYGFRPADNSYDCKVWANKNGYVKNSEWQAWEYYDKNPVTPRDFNVGELYITQVKAEANDSSLKVNDKVLVCIATAGQSKRVHELFRAPAKKPENVNGQVSADLNRLTVGFVAQKQHPLGPCNSTVESILRHRPPREVGSGDPERTPLELGVVSNL
jgi:hypothetical protein